MHGMAAQPMARVEPKRLQVAAAQVLISFMMCLHQNLELLLRLLLAARGVGPNEAASPFHSHPAMQRHSRK